MKDNNDCLDRDIEMLSMTNDANDQVEMRMAEFERLDWKLAIGLRDSSSDQFGRPLFHMDSVLLDESA